MRVFLILKSIIYVNVLARNSILDAIPPFNCFELLILVPFWLLIFLPMPSYQAAGHWNFPGFILVILIYNHFITAIILMIFPCISVVPVPTVLLASNLPSLPPSKILLILPSTNQNRRSFGNLVSHLLHVPSGGAHYIVNYLAAPTYTIFRQIILIVHCVCLTTLLWILVHISCFHAHTNGTYGNKCCKVAHCPLYLKKLFSMPFLLSICHNRICFTHLYHLFSWLPASWLVFGKPTGYTFFFLSHSYLLTSSILLTNYSLSFDKKKLFFNINLHNTHNIVFHSQKKSPIYIDYLFGYTRFSFYCLSFPSSHAHRIHCL